MNDAAAYIGELAREHGRNVQVAREMVTKATNLGAREALRKNVADVVAVDYPDLFRQIDGMTTQPKNLTISTPAPVAVERVEMSTEVDPRPADRPEHHRPDAVDRADRHRRRALEPGAHLPGTVGAISLIVGLYGLQVLPVSIAGLLLILLATASSSPRRSSSRTARSRWRAPSRS